MIKNIVVLGGGFGGLRATRQIYKFLKKSALLENYKIRLIDKNNFHTFTPLLYETATTSKQVADNLKLKSLIAYPLSELLRNKKIEFIQGEAQKVDLTKALIQFKNSELKFDYLVLALGSETNYFDIPGLKENSLALKTFEDAIKIRDAIWLKISEMKDLPTDAKNLQIVIGGGGSTGVELAGEIKEWLCKSEKEIGPECNVQTTIIERAPTVLSNFSEKVIKKVNERLEKLDVKIVSAEVINKVIPKAVVLENGKIIPFDVFVWTGGVKIPAVAMKLGLKTNERIETTPSLECLPVKHCSKLNSRVFAIGDNAGFGPQVARAAIIEADIAAKNIIEEIKKENNLCRETHRYRYKPKNYPYIIPVGGKFAVAKIGPFVISGFLGWFLKGLVELNYLISIMPFWKALQIWFTGLRIFVQNDRLG